MRAALATLALLLALLSVAWAAFLPGRDLRGTWTAPGYGLQFDIGLLRIAIHEVSPVHCLPRTVIPAHTWLLDRAAGYRFAPGPEGTLRIHVDEISNPIRATRSAPCSEADAPDTAIVWQSIADHYPDPPADWAASRDLPLPQMLVPLTYPTLALVTPDGAWQPATVPDWRADIPSFAALADRRLARPGGLPELGLTHGRIGTDIAYIRLDAVDAGRRWGSGARARARSSAAPDVCREVSRTTGWVKCGGPAGRRRRGSAGPGPTCRVAIRRSSPPKAAA